MLYIYKQSLYLTIYKIKIIYTMIKIKNAQLNNDAITALNNLIEMDIKAGAAFKLMRIIKEISSPYFFLRTLSIA